MSESVKSGMMMIFAVLLAVAMVLVIGTQFWDSSLKATDFDVAAAQQETVSAQPEVVVMELEIALPAGK